MTDWTFHPTLVAPFYLHFMNGNIVTLTAADERARIVAEFRSRLPEYEEPLLREMLASSWRPAKVAAWAIAARQLRALLPEVARRLVDQPSHVDQFCICLARLGGIEAEDALARYLQGCADGLLQEDAFDESIDPDWALAALDYLAPTRAAESDRQWRLFMERQRLEVRPHWERRLSAIRSTFDKVMTLFDTEFGPTTSG